MSTLQVDRIEPYQSASVTIVGLDIDTTALNNFTASQEALNGTFATTGSNTFSGNQTVNGEDKQTYAAPGDNQQVDNITITGATVTGTPFNVATVGFQDYGGNAFQDIFAVDFADSFSYNYYNSFYINGKATTFNLVPSGSVGGVRGTMRMRPNGANPTEVDTSIWGDTLYLQSVTNAMIISGSAGIGVDGVVTLNDTLKLTAQDPLPAGAVGELAVSGSNLYFYTDQWREVAFV